MCKSIAGIIADFLCGEDSISKDDREMYVYGFEVLFYSIEQAVILLFIGFFINMLGLTVLFVTLLLSLRRYTGGYHSKTRIGCTVTTTVMYLTVMFFTTYGINHINQWLTFFIYIFFYFLSFYLYAPVEHENKPLDDWQVKEYRKKGMCISIAWTIIAIVCNLICPNVSCCIVATMVVVAVSVVVSVKKRR